MAPRAKAGVKQQKAAYEVEGAAPAPLKTQVKRKRVAPVSTASTLQTKTLYASTRDELREIQVLLLEYRPALVTLNVGAVCAMLTCAIVVVWWQTELETLAQERRELIEADASGRKAVLPLLAPSEKKSW